MFEFKDISAGYNKRMVLNKVSVAIDPKLITVIMGPNGAGKSTLLKALYGLIPLKSGHAELDNQEIKPIPQKLVEEGIFMIPQGKRVFRNMTVLENIELATHFWSDCSDFEERLTEVLQIFPDLKGRLESLAGNLSGGQQQMVALARGFINRPRLMLLDEPSIGLSPKLINETFHLIKDLNEKYSTGFVIVEHNLKTLLPLTHKAYILDQGEIVYDGKAESKTLEKMLDRIFTKK